MRDLFDDDPGRAERFTVEDCGLLLDYSKNRVTAETMKLLVALAEAAGLKHATERMFEGEKINGTGVSMNSSTVKVQGVRLHMFDCLHNDVDWDKIKELM